MKLSVIVPAYNEENYLSPTLEAINTGLASFPGSELIVVDNESTDRTRAIAESFGATIVVEAEHNIGKVRNAGAARGSNDVLIFIDADTRAPEQLFSAIAAEMSDEACLGGAVAVTFGAGMPRFTGYYVRLCYFIGKLTRIRAGAGQFCRRKTFDELGGYDPTIYVGEDIEFQRRLDRLARLSGCRTAFITDHPVVSSPRRFARLGLLRTVIYSHPLTLFLLWRKKRIWRTWYEDAIR